MFGEISPAKTNRVPSNACIIMGYLYTMQLEAVDLPDSICVCNQGSQSGPGVDAANRATNFAFVIADKILFFYCGPFPVLPGK